MDLLYVIIGLVILLFAGDALVRGAVGLSLRLGIPAFIVSLTIVAFGTSAPELLIAIQAALDGFPGLALGNVVGSNIANVWLVLGIPALISSLKTEDCDTRSNYLFMLIVSVVFYGLSWAGPFVIWHGVVLLGLLAGMILLAIRDAGRSRKARQELAEELGETSYQPMWQILGFLLVGLIGLPIGANLLVDGAVSIAQRYGIDEAIIGLTLVAIGTSLPELATTVMAAIRRQAEVALGNVIGSNMFNLLAVMGVASFFGPLPVPSGFLSFDLLVMLAASLMLVPFSLMRFNLGRRWGLVFVSCYAGYITSLLI